MRMFTTQSYRCTITEIEVDKFDNTYVWATFHGKQNRFKKHSKTEQIWETFSEAKIYLVSREENTENLDTVLSIKEPIKASNCA